MSNKPLILLVEDTPAQIDCLREMLEDEGLSVLTAPTVQAACSLFAQHKAQLRIVALDGCLNARARNTDDLATQMSQDTEFGGFIAAMSGEGPDNQALIKAGCDCAVEVKKTDIVDIAERLVTLQDEAMQKLDTDWEGLRQEWRNRGSSSPDKMSFLQSIMASGK